MIRDEYSIINFKNIDLDISSKVLGRNIFVYNNSDYLFSDDILEYYVKVNNLDFKSASILSKNFLKQLNVSDFDPDLVPCKLKKDCLKQFKSIVKKDLTDYYFRVVPARYSLTNTIKEATYDHISSTTGRMKIVDGLNYLTMKKSDRSTLIKKDTNKSLVELDVKSCEPALLHAILYNETPDDIYSLFGKGLDRQKVKIAVISSLYGSTPTRVRKMTGLPKEEIKKIVDHFQIKKIEKSIVTQFNERGFFYNLYGRPIHDISSPVNYWLQSSAADYSCLAFLNLVERMNLKVRAVIHDAIIVEVEDSELDLLSKIKKINDPITNIKLRIEQTCLS